MEYLYNNEWKELKKQTFIVKFVFVRVKDRFWIL